MDNIETTISERELESRQQLIKNAQIGFQQYTDAYQEEWQRMTHSPISELAYPLTEVIQRRGNIPLHMFMAHALYGLDGYYSTGRALPNAGDFSTPSGNFASVFSLLSLGYDRLPYLPETMAIIGSGRGHFEKTLYVLRQSLPH